MPNIHNFAESSARKAPSGGIAASRYYTERVRIVDIFAHLWAMMKTIEVAAAIIRKEDRIFATQRGYGEWKDWWEFPGGKMEPGETPQQALMREIREELDAGIIIEKYLYTVEWDYPKFHLTMHCYMCTPATDSMHLNEHEAAKWLSAADLRSVRWLPADLTLLPYIETELAVHRIEEMEERYDRVRAAMEKGGKALPEGSAEACCGSVQAACRDDLEALREYYGSGQWLRDYEADEKGQLPAGLKRGVLSQDGLWDLLAAASPE